MRISERLPLIVDLFADGANERMGFSGVAELAAWVTAELGSLEVLDAPVRTETGWQRAKPVKKIYHVCAGNVEVSAETSLLIALLLGSEAVFKLPSTGLPAFIKRVERLPAVWKERIHFISTHDPQIMRECDAVVIFGSDATTETLRQECTTKQRVLCYGHKISVGMVTDAGATAEWAQAAVQEILAYQQLGCLSPQSYLCPGSEQVEVFSGHLVDAFRQQPFLSKEVSFDANAVIFNARQRTAVDGNIITIPCKGAPWTVVQRNESKIQAGPGFGFIEVVSAPAEEMEKMLDPWCGKISSVSISAEKMTPKEWKFWESFGVHRFCRMGNLQRPPIAWPHDGRPRLADLVHWTYADPDLSLEM